MNSFDPTILLVDHDRDFLTFASRHLGKLGYRVLKAHTATEAREISLTEPVRFIVIKKGMNGDGAWTKQLVIALKSDPATAYIPTLLTELRQRPVGNNDRSRWFSSRANGNESKGQRPRSTVLAFVRRTAL